MDRARNPEISDFGFRISDWYFAIRNPHSAFLLGFTFLFGAAAVSAGEVRLNSVRHERPVIPLFKHCELTIELEGPITNPYDPDEVALDAIFTPPRGEAVTVPAFYYQPFERVMTAGQEAIQPAGNPVWKVRFTPNRLGLWSYQVKLTTPRGTQTSPEGTIEVAHSTQRGFVGLDRQTGYFRFDDGQTFIPIGENLAWGPSNQPLAAYERWFRELATQRANFIRVWMAPWGFRLETRQTGVGRYDQARAWQLDYLLDRSEALGLYWQLCLLDHGSFSQSQDPEWQNNPYNEQLGGMCRSPNDFVTDPRAKAMFRRLLRYLVARFSYSPQLVSWELFNEADISDLDLNDFTPWLAQMSSWLRVVDPQHRPITVSFHHLTGETVWPLPAIDTIQQHIYDQRDFAGLFCDTLIPTLSQTFRKPVMIGEFGWIGEFMRKIDTDGIHLHDALWSSLIGGASGGALIWFWDQYVHPNHLERHFGPAVLFWRQEQIQQPLQRLTLSFSDADLGGCGIGTVQRAYVWIKNRTHNVDEYLAYRCALAKQRLCQARGQPTPPVTYPPRVVTDATATVRGLDRTGRYRVEWWDAYEGRILSSSVHEVRRGALMLTVPALRFDVAVKLVKLHWWERS